MHNIYVVDISSFRHARVHSAMGDVVREHLAKDTIEGAAVAAAQRIQARADALTPTGRTQAHAYGHPSQERSNDNEPGGRDLVGHSSVQAWSAGPIFPAVIARVETYGDENSLLPGVLYGTRWVLHYPGREDRPFLSYDGAFHAAQSLNAQRHAPA